MIRGVIEKIQNCEIPVNYRDPQEFMFGDERTGKSDVYSYGMYIFSEITGRSYFDCAGIPEDEMFMMADPDSERSVIDEKYIPEDFDYLKDLLRKMTVYSRDSRITLSEVKSELEKLTEEKENVENPAETDGFTADDINCKQSQNEKACRYSAEPDYDYGIILNNKRAGRIEFRPLLFHNGNTEKYTVPVNDGNRFEIAVSKRHRDFAHISNPSSVYGDNIIPVGIAGVEYINSQKTEISIENKDGVLKVNFSGASGDAGWC